MANTSLKLLGAWFSPIVWRVKIALNIKSLEYENIEETLNPKSQLLLQLNPVHQQIPVLLHGDRPICESRIIVEYIDEVWNSGASILPADAYDRAMARFWAAYIDDKCTVAVRNVVREEDEEARKSYLEEVEDVLVTMEGELQKCCREEGKGFFGGEEIGLVDITLGSLLRCFSMIETMNGRKLMVEAKHPGLVKWAERFGSHPIVKGLIPETEKLVEYAKALQMKLKAAAPSAE
ncbi:glutathione S-transferase U17-like [Neltuma alba]|uniref:glutathione S-transferase U17-like n=1 Tax=Neltuma alba TaxID=207710 RepID=UPI0010A2C575|nr:glutathione S-transferase U17-like [Prosopis alba]XP_028793097.1 glutathione S-transferase U17-like [Prosopis alba]XP_028793098.1 glutathione S-transferase U17-like [Prosopis alba]